MKVRRKRWVILAKNVRRKDRRNVSIRNPNDEKISNHEFQIHDRRKSSCRLGIVILLSLWFGNQEFDGGAVLPECSPPPGFNPDAPAPMQTDCLWKLPDCCH